MVEESSTDFKAAIVKLKDVDSRVKGFEGLRFNGLGI